MKTIRLILALTVAVATALIAGALVFKHAGHGSRIVQPVYAVDVARHVTPSPAASGDLLGALVARTGVIMSRATDHGTLGRGAAAVHLISAPTSAGRSCLVSDSAVGPAAACLDGATLFAQRPVAYLVQSDGGPDPANMNYLRVVGVAGPGVDAVAVVLSSGTTQPLSISSTRAFDYEAPLDTLHAGVIPTTLVAYENGKQIGTYPLS